MLTTDKLKEIANSSQTTELNTRREYVQHLFLSYFYQIDTAGDIFFKGGTALRIIYQSPRFSEDLDFSSPIKDLRKIEDAVLDTLKEIEREGIETEIIESKETSGGYLAIIKFSLGDERVNIQLEISFRDAKSKGQAVTVSSRFSPPFTIMQLRENQLISEKIKALLVRKKPRDFYDLYFIIRSNLLPQKERGVLREVLKLLNSVNFSFERELKHFLPKSHWAIIRNFKQTLHSELRRFI